jgi:GntR family transcriptional repressor for pyruvate dehydrogenase complex
LEIHDRVLDELREVILSSSRESGQLPTERELCQRLSISRPTLREHLQALEVVGLLRRDQGRGTFLQSPDGTALGSVVDLAMVAEGVPDDHLMFVRRVLERESAALAAGRLDAQMHARLTELCARMRAPLPSEQIADADHEFHMILFGSCGNDALRLLGATMSQALKRPVFEIRQYIDGDEAARRRTARAHDRVVEAVVSGDKQAAWEAMDAHFEVTDQYARRMRRERSRRSAI